MECKNCYGKGYATVYDGHTIGFEDFGGEGGIYRKGGIRVKLCSCNRGKDLRKLFTIKKKYRK
jgi:hypothetical protein